MITPKPIPWSEAEKAGLRYPEYRALNMRRQGASEEEIRKAVQIKGRRYWKLLQRAEQIWSRYRGCTPEAVVYAAQNRMGNATYTVPEDEMGRSGYRHPRLVDADDLRREW